MDLFHAQAHGRHGAAQAVLHALDGGIQHADFVVATLLDAIAQVAAGNAVEQAASLVQRAEHRPRKDRVQAHHQHRHHHQQTNQQDDRAIDAGRRIARHALAHVIGVVHVILDGLRERDAQGRDFFKVQTAGVLRLARANRRHHRRDRIALIDVISGQRGVEQRLTLCRRLRLFARHLYQIRRPFRIAIQALHAGQAVDGLSFQQRALRGQQHQAGAQQFGARAIHCVGTNQIGVQQHFDGRAVGRQLLMHGYAGQQEKREEDAQGGRQDCADT
ncbi:hypothetical protein D3C71_984270 [compost metagenome]